MGTRNIPNLRSIRHHGNHGSWQEYCRTSLAECPRQKLLKKVLKSNHESADTLITRTQAGEQRHENREDYPQHK